VLASEMGIEPGKLRDRLTLAWLGENSVEAEQLVIRVGTALDIIAAE